MRRNFSLWLALVMWGRFVNETSPLQITVARHLLPLTASDELFTS